MPDEAAVESILADFAVLYLADVARGAPKGAAEYYQLYPGYEDLIASEWRRLSAAAVDRLAPASDPAAAAPKTWHLGKYRIDRELGRGGQGTVYLAWDTDLDRRVALKVLKAAWTGSDALVRRFEIEAQALARMDPRGLATVYDAGELHGLRYFAMRYVEGRTFAQELAAEGRALPDREEVLRLVAIAEKAARSLHEAHEAGLVHRDVKPGNIMITQDDEPVLLDFGVARLSEGPGSLTQTGDVIGTPAFMAPEQLAGAPARVDRRADVYGLAATLHEALTTGPPLHDRSSATTDWPRAFRERASARRLNPRVPRDLDAVLKAALDPDPDHRYATSAALADDLERVRRGLPVAVVRRSLASRLLLWCRRAPAAAALLILTPTALTGGLVALSLKNHEVEQAARESSEKQREADHSAQVAKARFAEFQRLDDLRRIQDLDERSRELWPPGPDVVAGLERWGADARALVARLPEHRAALEALRGRGRIVDRPPPGVSPTFDEREHHERFRQAAKTEKAPLPAAHWRRAALDAFIEQADARIAQLDREVASRPVWTFQGDEDRWLHDSLETLVRRIEALTGPRGDPSSIAAVEERLATARALAEVSLRAPAAAWDEAVRAIANPATDPAYAGLRIEPILGLVPIGRDPGSRLWEFAVVLSGTTPARDAAGKLVITEDSAIVLVLIPGGTFRMGATLPGPNDDDGIDGFDSMARRVEQPAHDVTLDPFLISKFEMTQGQWKRATGKNPSHHHPDVLWEHGYKPNLRHPVERVSFDDCEDALRRFDLVLPTEAQWEYAARAGTKTPWWCGTTIQSFLHDENLADRTSIESLQNFTTQDAERNDGWAGPAPVGSYPANPWGLHDVIGNVCEWCADEAELYDGGNLPGDGLQCAVNGNHRAVRGGGFHVPASQARSSSRNGVMRTNRDGTIGLRPAKLVREP